jgi:hypothetical protein
MEEAVKKELVDGFKAAGLDVAEDAAVAAFKALVSMIPKVVLATDNKMDDLVIPVLAVLEPKILEALDKIDGVEG